MKGILALFFLAFAALAIGSDSNEGINELSCESKEGCCKDPFDCPGCCNPPYDNQCSNIKGVPLSFCEITGTYFITLVNYDPAIFAPFACSSANIAGNFPSQCQGTVYSNVKLNTTTIKTSTGGNTIVTTTFTPVSASEINVIRFSSCGHALVKLNIPDYNANNFTRLLGTEPFLVNAVVVAKNEAGLAVVACYAIYKSPAILVYTLSPTPKPNPWALQELAEALEPHNGYTGSNKLYSVNYTGCYPTLAQLGYN